MDRTAKTFLEYALVECKKGRRTEEAINFDEKLLKVAKFYNQPFFYDEKAGIAKDVFENFDVNFRIGLIKAGKEKQPKITIDDIIRSYQNRGKTLVWRDDVFSKYISAK
jgi:hypothetical protein